MNDAMERLNQGEDVLVGHRVLRKCFDCGNIVRMNKPIIGGLHFCSEEAAERERQRTGEVK